MNVGQLASKQRHENGLRVYRAIQELGLPTRAQIIAHTGLSEGCVGGHLVRLVEFGDVIKDRSTNPFGYKAVRNKFWLGEVWTLHPEWEPRTCRSRIEFANV